VILDVTIQISCNASDLLVLIHMGTKNRASKPNVNIDALNHIDRRAQGLNGRTSFVPYLTRSATHKAEEVVKVNYYLLK
jgi:hypothetical protein